MSEKIVTLSDGTFDEHVKAPGVPVMSNMIPLMPLLKLV